MMSVGGKGIQDHSKKINYIPTVCYFVKSWPHTILCPGCYSVFPCVIDSDLKFPSPKFFDHCVNECRKYQSLRKYYFLGLLMKLTYSTIDLTRECEDCWSVFVDDNLYDSHVKMCNVIAEHNLNIHGIKSTNLDYTQDKKGTEPNVTNDDSSGDESDLELTNDKEALVIHIPKKSLECMKFREKISCLGCGKSYPGTMIREKVIEVDGTIVERDTIIGRRDYYNHCIFKCIKYQELNLTSLCLQCNKFFLDPDEFVTHQMTSCNTVAPIKSQEGQQCPCCSKMIPSLKKLRKHITAIHDASKISDEVLQSLTLTIKKTCLLCQKAFFTKNGYSNHMRVHDTTRKSGDHLDECITEVAFSTAGSAQESIVARGSILSSDPCGSSKSYEQLKINEASISKGEPTLVSVAQEPLSATESVSVPLQTAVNETQVIEDEQGTSATQDYEIECSKAFSKSDIEAIIDGLSPIKLDPSTICASDDYYQCVVCFLTVPDLMALKIHFLDNHFGEGLDCTNCNLSCATMSTLVRHFTECHESAAKTIARGKGSKKRRGNKILEKVMTDQFQSFTTKKIKAVCDDEKTTSKIDSQSQDPQQPKVDLNSLSMTDDNYCLGCNKVFPLQYHISNLYHHCIYECDEYSKLGLKRACTICRGMFMNQQLLDEHKLNFCSVITLN